MDAITAARSAAAAARATATEARAVADAARATADEAESVAVAAETAARNADVYYTLLTTVVAAPATISQAQRHSQWQYEARLREMQRRRW
jgi:hypothetical protein